MDPLDPPPADIRRWGHGAIDFSTRRSLAASIDRALHDLAGRRLDLDLTGVRFIDSTGLQALMRALVKCEDASVAWTLRPSQDVEKLLVLVGVGRLRSDQSGNWLHGGGYGTD